jgi:hypothetical protein
MGFFSRFAPLSAYRDLRRFLATRQPYELGFFVLALAITAVLIFAFLQNSQVDAPYKRQIIYVQQWRADRTDGEIKAQQLIDEAAKQKQAAIDAAEREKRRLEFKRLDDSLSNMGL